MMSRNGEEESDMADVYENAENNFNINDIGVQKLEIRSSAAGVTSAKYGDDYRTDENINYVNRSNEPSFDGDVIAMGGKASNNY